MSLANFTVEYSTNYSTWTQLTNVQSVSLRIGRQKLTDVFNPSGCSVTLRYPTGFASPITALKVGTYVRVNRTGANPIYGPLWTGTINDVAVDYGLPYVSGVGNADYVTFSAEGGLAYAGRAQGNDYAITQGRADIQLMDAESGSGVQFDWDYTYSPTPLLASSIVTGSYAEWVNTLATSINASILDGGNAFGLVVRPRDYDANLTVSFSDTTNNATNQVYDIIRFDSLASDYYTQVQVETNTVGTVTRQTGSAPYRTLVLDTFNVSTGQATDLADYNLGIFSEPTFGISEISCKAEAQNTIALELGTSWWGLIGARTSVRFRGNTYAVSILGATIEGRPDSTRYTYYLADADLTPYLVLDSPTLGILDTNKLSY